MHIASVIRQKSYEKVVYMLRRHPVTFVPKIAFFLLLFALPLVLGAILSALFPGLLEGSAAEPVALLCAGSYTLSILIFFYTAFTEYYLDVWVVTNDRIIDMEQHGLFSRTVSELDLFHIQDVTTDMHGLFSTFFNYGDVTVNTASANTSIIFRNIPKPNRIREDLIRLSHEDRKYHSDQAVK